MVKYFKLTDFEEQKMAGGRQRAFDKQIALEQAMLVFWQKGYAGASLIDLTERMGITKPSMYAAFGNKEQLFIQAMQYYMENYANKHAKYLYEDKLPLLGRLKNYLLSIMASQCGKDAPTGCFLSVCITESVNEDMPVEAQKVIEEIKHLGESVLTAFFNTAQHDLLLSADYEAEQLAQYFVSIMHGTAAMARAGKTIKDLVAIVDTALLVINPISVLEQRVGK